MSSFTIIKGGGTFERQARVFCKQSGSTSRYHNLITCGPVVIPLKCKLDFVVYFRENLFKKIINFNGQNHDFGKSNGFMEKSVEFVMTKMSHDGSETTSQL